MRAGRVGIAVAVLGLLCAAAPAQVLVNIPLDQQIDIGQGPAIYVPTGLNGSLSFQPGSPGWVRNMWPSADSWYYGPYVDFHRTGNGDLDCTNAKLEIDLRYFKEDGNYGDAPIFLRIYSIDGGGNYLGHRDYGIIYAVQPPWNDPPAPAWTHKTVWLNNPAMNPYTDGGTFSIASVGRIRLYGSDWGADPTQTDYIDAKQLVITNVPPAIQANAGPDQTFPNAACTTQVTLDGSGSTGPITRYLWKEGSTTLADLATPVTQVWISSGVHTITLFVYDASNNVDSDEMVVTIPDYPPQGLPVNVAMDQQINNAITGGPLQFLSEGGDGFTRRLFTVGNGANGYWEGPRVNLDEACFGILDLTGENIYLRFTARFYKQSGNYNDVPIFVGLRDADGTYAEMGLLYQPNSFGQPIYPEWARVTSLITFTNPPPPEFDQTQVKEVQFRGTDWGGTGNDFVDIKDLFIGVLIPPVADAGPDQTLPGSGCAPSVPVTVNGSGSSPGGGGSIVRYVWSYLGTVLQDSANPVLTTTLQGAGAHYLTLTVYDNDDLWDSDEVKITIGTAQPLPVEISLDEQIDYGLGHAITADYGVFFMAFVDPETGNNWPWVRIYTVGGDWYFAPTIDLTKACYGVIDISPSNMELHFTARYFQDASNWNPDFWGDPNDPLEVYEDAPIFVAFRDVNGKYGSLGILYGPDMRLDPNKYPNWKTIEVPIDILPEWPTDADFDPTKVVTIEFFGTDWGGLGTDFVDIRDVFLGPVGPATCVGDTNCDGVVSFGDINPFVAGLTGGPLCNPANFDINGNGTVGFDDINPFVAYLSAHQGETCP